MVLFLDTLLINAVTSFGLVVSFLLVFLLDRND